MTPAFTACLLVFTAIIVIRPRPGRGLHRLTHQQSRPPRPGRSPHGPLGTPDRGRFGLGVVDRGRFGPRWFLVLPALAVLGLLGAQVLVGTMAIAVVLTLIVVQRAQHQRRAAAASRRQQIIEALDVLAADLTAGRPPVDALEGAAAISPDFTIAHAAARLGGDVPGSLEVASESPGATGLRALAAAWRVAEESGAAFAALTERLADSLRADEAIHRQTEASLAGARSTARLLAALPLFGIALGYALGAQPLTFLTTTPPGYLCLFAGLTLTALGLHWTTHLANPPT